MKNIKVPLCIILTLVMTLFMVASCAERDEAFDPFGLTNSSDSASTDSAVPHQTTDGSFSYSDGLDDNGFWIGVKATDYIEMFNYQAMQIPRDTHVITDERLQQEIDAILEAYPNSVQVLDRAIIDGDTVNIDFVGSINGINFEGGSTGGEGTDVTIGVDQYIDDFLEQLIGHTPGEKINIEVTFPDDYFEESLQGRDALFITDINFIVENGELTDEYVMINLSAEYGWQSVAEMDQGLRDDLKQFAIRSYIQEYFAKDVTILAIPDSMLEYQEKAMLSYYQGAAEQYGVTIEELISANEGYSSVEELIESTKDYNTSSVVYYLVLQAIAEDAGIIVEDVDIFNFFELYNDSVSYEEFVMQYGLPCLKQLVLCDKVLEFVIGNAVLL